MPAYEHNCIRLGSSLVIRIEEYLKLKQPITVKLQASKKLPDRLILAIVTDICWVLSNVIDIHQELGIPFHILALMVSVLTQGETSVAGDEELKDSRNNQERPQGLPAWLWRSVHSIDGAMSQAPSLLDSIVSSVQPGDCVIL